VDLAAELATTTPGLDLPGLMGLLKERAQAKNPPRMQGVTLASIHAAKGLEWDAVFLVGLVDGTVPIRHALKGSHSEDAIEEERRLLYVGVTRAREHLHLSWSQARQPGRQGDPAADTVPRRAWCPGRPSADEQQRPAAAVQQRGPKAKPRDACENCGTRLTTPEQRILGVVRRPCAEIDQVLVTELRRWRSPLAKLAGCARLRGDE
jgi:DNA helicase-2/ATP-dependent DNA helicase PcrA